MTIPNVLGQTPGWNGYGVTLESNSTEPPNAFATLAGGNGQPLSNAFSQKPASAPGMPMSPPIMQRQQSDVSGGGVPQRKPTEADKVRDREMAKNLTDWSLGGQQTAYTNLEALAGVIRDLESGKQNYTGPVIGNNPFRKYYEQPSIDAEDRVGRVVQQSLRAILGGNFAKDEADQLIQRSYNVKLDEKYNVQRLKLLHDELVRRAQMMDSAANYYSTNGSLMGFEGRMPGMSDFQTLGAPSGQPKRDTKDLSDEELLGALGMN